MNSVEHEQERIAEQGVAITEQALATVILTPAHYESAVELLNVAAAFKAEVKAVFDPICDAANKAHKAATKARKDQMAPFIEAEKVIKERLNGYDLEQERIKRAEEARRERERREQEAKVRAEQDRLLEEAAKLEAEGKTDEAGALVDDAADIQDEFEAAPEIVVQTVTPKGVSYIDNWKAEIVNAVAVPRQYCTPDQRMLDNLAKGNKGENAPAGVRFVNNRTIRRG